MIPLFKPFIPPMGELLPALRKTFESGYIAMGDRVAEFECKFGERVGNENSVATSSCTAALHLALELSSVRGGEVITTPMTAEPTNLAILHAGAEVVWADVDPFSGNIDPASVAECVNERTRAVMVVHYAGTPVDLDAVYAAAGNLPVIEDAAHALGAWYDGRPIGCHTFACFSFQAIKHMSTGDGGMLTCRHREDAERARLLRWFGIDRHAPRDEMDINDLGYKYNMNDVTATIGLVQMNHVDWVLSRHIDNGRFFDQALSDVPGLDLCRWSPKAEPSYWLYTVLADNRDGLVQKLRENGVSCGRVHRRNDRHTVFEDSERELPGLDKFWARMLHIPCGWWVEDRERIVDVIRSGW